MVCDLSMCEEHYQHSFNHEMLLIFLGCLTNPEGVLCSKCTETLP